jgi:membrane protein
MTDGTKAGEQPRTRRVQQVTQWGKQKYTGSSAESLQRRLTGLDFLNQGLLFAGTLLLCALPFLIVVLALAGHSAASGIGRRMGLNAKATRAFDHLFATPSATSAAVIGSASMVLFVVSGIAVASTLQALYERIFEVERRGWRNLPRQLLWLGLTVGALLTSSAAAPSVRTAGPVVFNVVALVWFTSYWWLTTWLLLGSRVTWRRLLPCACATGLFWLGMEIVFSLFVSGMVISDDKEYGPIGVVFAIMSFLVAIGVVVILGAAVGLVWQERERSFTAAVRRRRQARVIHR